MTTPTLKAIREQHIPTYRRKRLGSGTISGRSLWATHVSCSCGWQCTINQPKQGAEQDWKLHTRMVWKGIDEPTTTPDTAVEKASNEAADPAWNDFQRWQQRQQRVKACPCCASQAHWSMGKPADREADKVQCSGCGLLLVGTYEPESALTGWNKRADTAA